MRMLVRPYMGRQDVGKGNCPLVNQLAEDQSLGYGIGWREGFSEAGRGDEEVTVNPPRSRESRGSVEVVWEQNPYSYAPLRRAYK